MACDPGAARGYRRRLAARMLARAPRVRSRGGRGGRRRLGRRLRLDPPKSHPKVKRELMKQSFDLLERSGVRKADMRKAGAGDLAARICQALLVLAGLAAAVTFFLLRASDVGAVDEDAFISFRYAQNLLAGEGLVFNPDGQRVEGITNLLWTLFVAAGAGITGAGLPTVSVTLGLTCGALVLVLAWSWVFEELAGSGVSWFAAASGALLAPLLLAAAPGFAFYAASGLEVAFFALLVTAGLYFLRVGGKLWCAAVGSLLLGAAFMTRPEAGLALVFAAAAYSLWPGKERRGRALAAALPGLAVLAAVTLWRLHYYGSLVPNTAFAKAGGFEVMERWGWPYVVEVAGQNWFHLAWLVAALGAVSHPEFLKRNLAALCLAPVWAAYIVYAGGDYMPFGRFVLPMLPVLYILAVVGGGLAVRALVGSSDGLRAWAGAAAVALPLVTTLAVFVMQVPEQVEREERHAEYLRAMAERRQAAANWFDEHRPNALVARNGVGAFGYYSDLRLLDMLGLNDRYIAHHGEKFPSLMPGHQTSDAEYILRREPDYIMMGNVEPPFRFASDRVLGSTPEFREEYEPVRLKLEDGLEVSLWRREAGASGA